MSSTTDSTDGRANFSPAYIADYSRLLIILAWTVEILAVSIGFTISVMVSISAYQSFATSESVNLLDETSTIFIAALPFALVAAVELCKIPLTFAFMTASQRGWRILFLFSVLFLCLVTFQTMFNGFERNFSNLNRAIDSRKGDIEDTTLEIQTLKSRKGFIEKFTEAELMDEIEAARSAIADDSRLMAEQTSRRTSRALKNIDYSFRKKFEADMARLEGTREKYYGDWDRERDQVHERFSTLLTENIRGSADERGRLASQLELLREEMDVALAQTNFFSRGGVEDSYRERIQEKENQISRITSGYLGGEALEKQAVMESQLNQANELLRIKYEKRIEEVNQRIESLRQQLLNREQAKVKTERGVYNTAAARNRDLTQLREENEQELDDQLAKKLAELEEIGGQLSQINEAVFELDNNRRVLQLEINRLINQNQLFRMAMYAYGVQSPTDVDRRMVASVALFWFGTLALIASVSGVLLAAAGFYLRRFKPELETDSEPEEQLAS